MDSSVQIAIVNVAALVVSSVTGAFVAWIAYKQASLGKTIRDMEVNTNSMKDALVASTKVASHAAGVLDEKAAEAVRKDVLAQGALAEKNKVNTPLPGNETGVD